MEGIKKGYSKWIFKTHQKANWEDVFEIVSKLENGVQLRFLCEPLIIHVKCVSLEKAEALLSKLHCNGFKKSCLISFKSNLIEINDTGKMECIVSNELSAGYVKQLVEEANVRLGKTKMNIEKLGEIV
jgi:tRNA(Phe) wybutosine-synthesizing methylase Tyw3